VQTSGRPSSLRASQSVTLFRLKVAQTSSSSLPSICAASTSQAGSPVRRRGSLFSKFAVKIWPPPPLAPLIYFPNVDVDVDVPVRLALLRQMPKRTSTKPPSAAMELAALSGLHLLRTVGGHALDVQYQILPHPHPHPPPLLSLARQRRRRGQPARAGGG